MGVGASPVMTVSGRGPGSRVAGALHGAPAVAAVAAAAPRARGVRGVAAHGGEAAHLALGLSDKAARVFQGMLLFWVLACDTLVLYRIRFVGGSSAAEPAR